MGFINVRTQPTHGGVKWQNSMEQTAVPYATTFFMNMLMAGETITGNAVSALTSEEFFTNQSDAFRDTLGQQNRRITPPAMRNNAKTEGKNLIFCPQSRC